MSVQADDLFTDSPDPFGLFSAWMAEATASEPNDPNAMALASVDADGSPDVRMVLLKGVDARGFVFYTNTESAKGGQLAANRSAALVLHWKSLRRQVRAKGPVESVADADADAYFRSRSRDSRIGAWASQQSRVLASRALLEEAAARYDERFRDEDVPRPPHWSGYRIAPLRIEFWRDRPHRLHDRLVLRRDAVEEPWATERLFP